MINQASKKIDYKSERGITLITLTITIIILVILASITVGVAFGDNGLLKGSEKIEQVKRIEKYKTTIDGVAYEQYTDYIMEDKQGSLRDKTKNKIKTLDFVKEANNGAEDDEINVITKESYLIIVKLENENTDVIHEGENDEEPLPKITREYIGKENGKYKIKASATVEKTEKTTAVAKIELVEPKNTIENYEEGKEIIFEVDKPGKYWIQATTNVGKSIKEPIIVKDDDIVESSFEVILPEQIYTYNGKYITPEVTVKDKEKVLIENTNYTIEYSNNINAGIGNIKIEGKGIYSGKVITKTFNINKADLTITATNKTMTYGGTVPTCTYTVSGYVNNETSSVLGGTVSYEVKNSSGTTVTVSKTTNAGTYTITPLGLSATNYSITYKAGTLTINKATATMTVSNTSKIIQDGSNSTFTYTYNGDGAVTVKSSDNSIATCSVNTSTKTVKVNALKTSTKAVTITVSAAAGTNYNAISKTVQIGAIVISGVPTSWTNKDQKITATTTLTGHTVQTMKDTGSWQTASSQTFTANGTFFARVLNSSSTSVGSKSINITKIDKIAPEITKTGAEVNKNVITVSMIATDNSGETPSYWYNIDGGTFQKTNTFTVSGIQVFTIGYKAIDAAGNETVVYKKETNGYTITYDANGGTGAPASQTKMIGENLTLSSTVPTKTGYTFLGWSTSSTATTATYAKGATYTENKTATLYAVWQVKTVKVTFMRNIDSSDTTSNVQTFTYGVTGQKFSDKGWTRTGYTLLGWSTDKNATSKTFELTSSVDNSFINARSPAITLYAVWQVKTVKVTFMRNINSSDTTSNVQTFTYGVTGQKFSDKGWTRTGYTLLGWSEDKNATDKKYSVTSGVVDAWINTYSPSTTLYAVWKANSESIIGEEAKGVFIMYDVEYTDTYMNYEYTSTNGWRLENYDLAEDGKTLSNVRLISTGVPARMSYDTERISNNYSYWINDNTKLTTFIDDILGSDYDTLKQLMKQSYSLCASAGYYYNLGKMTFEQGTTYAYDNQGYYTKVKNKSTTYTSGETTGDNLFKARNDASIRLLTARELIKAVGTYTIFTDNTGLYQLNKIYTGTQLSKNTYTTGNYLLASPYKEPNKSADAINISTVTYAGVKQGRSDIGAIGVRPLVTITSKVQLVKKTDDTGFVYYEMVDVN